MQRTQWKSLGILVWVLPPPGNQSRIPQLATLKHFDRCVCVCVCSVRAIFRNMPPVKGENASDKAARFARKSQELVVKASYQRILACLKARPDAVHTVEQHLISCGMMTGGKSDDSARKAPAKAKSSAGGGGSQKAPKRVLRAICSNEKEDMQDEEDEALAEDFADGGQLRAAADKKRMFALEDGEASDDDMAEEKNELDPMASKFLDKNQSHYQKLNLVEVQWLLSKCEPAALSESNLKALMRRGQRLESLSKLLEILEFISNESPQSSITGDHRMLGNLLKHIDSKNLETGRRGRDLSLPPDWEQQGVYRLAIFGERLFIAHKFKDGLRAEIHPPHPARICTSI